MKLPLLVISTVIFGVIVSAFEFCFSRNEFNKLLICFSA